MIGYIGAALLMVCALPQAIQSYRQGHSRGINQTFLLSWYFGEILMLYYVYDQASHQWPLLLNYLFNTVLVSVIVKYKYLEVKRG